MSERPSKAARQQLYATLKKNSVRTILNASTCCIIFIHILTISANYLDAAVFSAFVIYSIASGLWLKIAKERALKHSYFPQITTLDGALISAVLAYFFHSFTFSGIMFCIVAFNGVMVGSLRQAIADGGAFITAAGAVTLMTNVTWNSQLEPLATTTLFFGSLAYFGYFGFYIHHRFTKLNQSNKKLYNDLVVHKVRTYKLSRYVTPTVWRALNQGRDESLKTERKRLSIFFSDIEGFSSLSEELEPETLTDLLNTYLTEMVKIAAKHQGTIDKFMGDGLMVIFGDTNSGGMKADCLRCLSMAIDMRKKMKELENVWFNQGIKKPLRIRMGINSGYCTVGTFGTTEYMDYTVLGTHVNLASRLESAADSGEILISHETWSLIKDTVMCRDRGEIKVKGFSHPVKVYQVADFRKELGKNQSYFEERLQGFSMHLDLEKVKNYDRDRIIEQLDSLTEKLRENYS